MIITKMHVLSVNRICVTVWEVTTCHKLSVDVYARIRFLLWRIFCLWTTNPPLLTCKEQHHSDLPTIQCCPSSQPGGSRLQHRTRDETRKCQTKSMINCLQGELYTLLFVIVYNCCFFLCL